MIHDTVNSGFVEYESPLLPPFYGTGEMLCWESRALLQSIDIKLIAAAGAGTKETADPFLPKPGRETDDWCEGLIEELVRENLIDARGYYAFFPVITDNETLILISPDDFHTEIASILFPRLAEKGGRSFADFFRPEGDTLVVSLVSAGLFLSKRCLEYSVADAQRAASMDAVGMACVEALNAKIHTEITRTFFLPKNYGAGCAFGMPGMPERDQQAALLELVCAEERLGITHGDDYQLNPRHAGLRVITLHPEAACDF